MGNKYLVTIEEAKEAVHARAWVGFGEEVCFTDYVRLGVPRVIAEDIAAPFSYPLFDNSAVDGYALGSTDRDQWILSDQVIPAGEVGAPIEAHQAVRIFTGARVPPGCVAVAMQEIVEVEARDDGSRVLSLSRRLEPGAHVRRSGEQFEAGQVIARASEVLNPTMAASLASAGLSTVLCHRLPRLGVVVTGNEFLPAGEDPASSGKIFESNGLLVEGLARGLSTEIAVMRAPDTLAGLTEVIRQIATESDVVVTTGGVSVGDYDFVPQALAELGFETVFHGVAQKPGKPFLFAVGKGVDGHRLAVFGLPGNPRAVAVCFQEYVRPFLRHLAGVSGAFSDERVLVPLAVQVEVGERDEYLAVSLVDGAAQVLERQGSHMLDTLAYADGMILVRGAPGGRAYQAGEAVGFRSF